MRHLAALAVTTYVLVHVTVNTSDVLWRPTYIIITARHALTNNKD